MLLTKMGQNFIRHTARKDVTLSTVMLHDKEAGLIVLIPQEASGMQQAVVVKK